MSRNFSDERKLKPTTYGVGFIGIGKHSTRINKIRTPANIAWGNMMSRCYREGSLKRNPQYIGCSVCTEWHNFQNFAEWFENNLPNKNVLYELDKDILVKGNKVYSPDTCCFVPKNINSLLTTSKNIRGNLPIGVSIKNNKFQSKCNNGNKKSIYLGVFDTKEDAFYTYKRFKENLIESLAYQALINNEITEKVYNTLASWDIKITD